MAVSPKGSDGSAKNTTKQIREWAVGEGLEVSSRGRISAEIEQAFHDAHAKKAQTETASVKKEAVTKSPVARTVVSKASVKKSSGEIREWAVGEGLEVSSRGRISAEIERAFYAAHAKKAQVEPASVKKTAATKTAVKKTVVKKPPVTAKAAAEKQITAKAPAKGAPVSTPPATTTREIRE